MATVSWRADEGKPRHREALKKRKGPMLSVTLDDSEDRREERLRAQAFLDGPVRPAP